MDPEHICTTIQELCRKHHVYGNSLLAVYLFERFYGIEGITKGYLNHTILQKSVVYYYFVYNQKIYDAVVFPTPFEYTITSEPSYEVSDVESDTFQNDFFQMLLTSNIEPYWIMCNERSYKLFEELLTRMNYLGKFITRRKKKLNSSEPCACSSGKLYKNCHQNFLF